MVTMHSTMFEVLQKTVYNVVVEIRKIQHIKFWVLSTINTYLKVWSLIDFFSHRLPFSVCKRYLCERSISNLIGGSQSVMKTSIFTRSLLTFLIINKWDLQANISCQRLKKNIETSRNILLTDKIFLVKGIFVVFQVLR